MKEFTIRSNDSGQRLDRFLAKAVPLLPDLAVDSGLEIVPVVNKIDLPSADPKRVKEEIEDVIGIPAEDAPEVSAKAGINIHDVMERIVSDVPAPQGDDNNPLQALIFDSYYDAYKGVIIYIRVKEGTVKPGDEIKLMATGSVFTVVELGYMRATSLEPAKELCAGEVGYIAASIKSVQDAKVGDTVTLANNPATEPLPGYREVQSMVYCGVYPADGAKYSDLRDALEKLKLNDASLTFEPEGPLFTQCIGLILPMVLEKSTVTLLIKTSPLHHFSI